MTIEQYESKPKRVRIMHVRVPRTDWQAILTISGRLDLGVSEIARRALRLGLAALKDAELPDGNRL